LDHEPNQTNGTHEYRLFVYGLAISIVCAYPSSLRIQGFVMHYASIGGFQSRRFKMDPLEPSKVNVEELQVSLIFAQSVSHIEAYLLRTVSERQFGASICAFQILPGR
jgi:hypothetical protein